MSDYDLIVVGAGPGGYPAAIRGAQLGLRVAVVEKEKLGGVCLNWGCVPSKALLKSAEMLHNIRNAKSYGINVTNVEVDFAQVIKRSRKTSKRFGTGVKGLFKKYGVETLSGTARVSAADSVIVVGVDGKENTYTAKHIVVATGARALSFPGLEPDGKHIWTYREAITSTECPESIVIVGAGAIGIEFAYFFNAMGSKVTVVEGQSEILPNEDVEVAAELRKQLTKQGIEFQIGVLVQQVSVEKKGIAVTLSSDDVLHAEKAIIALGVRPNVEGIGLEDVGVEVGRRGIVVDSSYRTNVDGIYAVGDVCDRGAALAHVATRAAHVLVERIMGLEVPDIDDTMVPSCTYCIPQVASVGYTEQSAIAAGYNVSVAKFPFMANAKAHGAGHPEGFVKVVVDTQYSELLGAHIVGADATEMIGEFVLARSSEATAELISTTIHAHPTLSETSMEAVALALGHTVHL
jgi:dihydrolipoamide dehydrogenase